MWNMSIRLVSMLKPLDFLPFYPHIIKPFRPGPGSLFRISMKAADEWSVVYEEILVMIPNGAAIPRGLESLGPMFHNA